MAKTRALSDNHRSIIGFVVTAVIAIGLYMATLPEDQRPPPYVYGILGAVVVIAQVAKDQFGVRDATTARIAKDTSPTLEQHRKIPEPND